MSYDFFFIAYEIRIDYTKIHTVSALIIEFIGNIFVDATFFNNNKNCIYFARTATSGVSAKKFSGKM